MDDDKRNPWKRWFVRLVVEGIFLAWPRSFKNLISYLTLNENAFSLKSIPYLTNNNFLPVLTDCCCALNVRNFFSGEASKLHLSFLSFSEGCFCSYFKQEYRGTSAKKNRRKTWAHPSSAVGFTIYMFLCVFYYLILETSKPIAMLPALAIPEWIFVRKRFSQTAHEPFQWEKKFLVLQVSVALSFQWQRRQIIRQQ